MADITMFKCHSNKDEAKCGRIFRPWDQENQDATISTTTLIDVEEKSGRNNETKEPKQHCNKCDKVNEEGKQIKDKKTTKQPKITDKLSTLSSSASKKQVTPKRTELIKTTESNSNPFHLLPMDEMRIPLEDHFSASHLYPPDFLHGHLTHPLGCPVNDPMLLESLSTCTFEEYTNFLAQEHQAKLLNARKQRPKKYKCPHCEVGFSNNGQLKGHIRIHTGERPFKCDEKNCGKTFTRNEELTRHKRIHSGLRPFPCSHCGKRFGRKDHLKKHSRTHFQPRGMFAVPVMLPFDATWTPSSTSYPYPPMFGY